MKKIPVLQEKEGPEDKAAMIAVLKALKQVASEMMAEAMNEKLKPSEDMESMKKVSVMAKDEEGLEEGLEKAKEIVEGMEGSEMMADKSEDDSEEESEDEEAQMMAESSDLEKLKALRSKMS